MRNQRAEVAGTLRAHTAQGERKLTAERSVGTTPRPMPLFGHAIHQHGGAVAFKICTRARLALIGTVLASAIGVYHGSPRLDVAVFVTLADG